MSDADDEPHFVRVTPSDQIKGDLLNSMVAVLHDVTETDGMDIQSSSSDVTDVPQKLVKANVALFLCILAIDIDRETIILRSPCPIKVDTLPSKYFLLGSVKWIE